MTYEYFQVQFTEAGYVAEAGIHKNKAEISAAAWSENAKLVIWGQAS